MDRRMINRPPLEGAPQQSKRWAFMKKFVIPDFDEPDMPYLIRWRVVQTPWFSFYVHRILLDDSGREPHDHPWTFGSFILWGGYTEKFLKPYHRGFYRTSIRSWGMFSWHKVHVDEFHSITDVKPNTISLVFTGPRRQVWGFLTPDGWKPWYELRVEQRAV